MPLLPQKLTLGFYLFLFPTCGNITVTVLFLETNNGFLPASSFLFFLVLCSMQCLVERHGINYFWKFWRKPDNWTKLFQSSLETSMGPFITVQKVNKSISACSHFHNIEGQDTYRGTRTTVKKKTRRQVYNYLHSKLGACGAFQQILQQLTCADITTWENETPIPNEQGSFSFYLGMDTGHFVLF